jgi:hypothetical protein
MKTYIGVKIVQAEPEIKDGKIVSRRVFRKI